MKWDLVIGARYIWLWTLLMYLQKNKQKCNTDKLKFLSEYANKNGCPQSTSLYKKNLLKIQLWKWLIVILVKMMFQTYKRKVFSPLYRISIILSFVSLIRFGKTTTEIFLSFHFEKALMILKDISKSLHIKHSSIC